MRKPEYGAQRTRFVDGVWLQAQRQSSARKRDDGLMDFALWVRRREREVMEMEETGRCREKWCGNLVQVRSGCEEKKANGTEP